MDLMTSWERKGRQEGRLDNIRRPLRILLGAISAAQDRKLRGLTEAQLAELAEALLEFSASTDLDEWLARHR